MPNFRDQAVGMQQRINACDVSSRPLSRGAWMIWMTGAALQTCADAPFECYSCDAFASKPGAHSFPPTAPWQH